jgi:hypothetical protein
VRDFEDLLTTSDLLFEPKRIIILEGLTNQPKKP